MKQDIIDGCVTAIDRTIIELELQKTLLQSGKNFNEISKKFSKSVEHITTLLNNIDHIIENKVIIDNLLKIKESV